MSSIGNMGKAVGVAFSGPILATAGTVLVAGIHYSAGSQDLVNGIYDYAMKVKHADFTKEEVIGLGVLGVGTALLSLALWGVYVLIKRCCAKTVTLNKKDAAEKMKTLAEKKSTVTVPKEKLAPQAQEMQAMTARLMTLEETSKNDKIQLEKTVSTLSLKIQNLEANMVSLTEDLTESATIKEAVSTLSTQILDLNEEVGDLCEEVEKHGAEWKKDKENKMYVAKQIMTQLQSINVLKQGLINLEKSVKDLQQVAEFQFTYSALDAKQQELLDEAKKRLD